MASVWLSPWLRQLPNSCYADDLGFGVGKTRSQRRLDAPTFSGFGQFGIYILTLGKQTKRPGFQQRIRGGQQRGKGRQRPCRYNVHRHREVFDKIFKPDRMDLGGHTCRMDCFAQEGRLLGTAFDQMHARPRHVRERAGDDYTRKPGPGAEIDPDSRLRCQRQKLKRIGDVASP